MRTLEITTASSRRGRPARWPRRLFLAMALMVAGGSLAWAQAGGDFELSWSTIDSGAPQASAGGDFDLKGTFGQPDAALSGGGDFDLRGGFWNSTVANAALPVEISAIIIR